MKNIFVICLLFLTASISFAQDNEVVKNTVTFKQNSLLIEMRITLAIDSSWIVLSQIEFMKEFSLIFTV